MLAQGGAEKEEGEMSEVQNCGHRPSSFTAPPRLLAADSTHGRKFTVPIERHEYASSTSSITLTIHQTSLAQAGPTKPRNSKQGDPSIASSSHALRAADTQTLQNADDGLENPYRYFPLPPGSIRLLRLMPHKDKNACIQCQLIDYPLQELGEVTHLYEALSYVWGDPENPRSISIDKQSLPVTANLHAALLRLRDRLIVRIIWVDAICINQGDVTEKGKQVRYMAEIYSKASRVIVWLGEAENDSDQALEEIRLAADETSTEPLVNEPTKQAILALLQRPWFERIWVKK